MSKLAIIRWNPWNLSHLLDDDLDLPSPLSRFGLSQGLNLYETEDEVVAEAAIPGIPEHQVDVTVDDGVVRITGSSEEKQEDKGKRRYYMTSRASSFNYSFRLPAGLVSDEEPDCELDNGIIHLRFKKIKKTPPKKITVKAVAKK